MTELTMLFAGSLNGNSLQVMKSALLILALISVAIILCSIVGTFSTLRRRNKPSPLAVIVLILLYITAILCAVCTVVSFSRYQATEAMLLGTKPIETAPSTTASRPLSTRLTPMPF